MNEVETKTLRLPKAYRLWLKKRLRPLGTPYLFGSRTDMEEKGGDIDLLLLTEKRISYSKLAVIRKDFILKFGDQKLDLINFTYDEKSPFKEMVMMDAIPL